eukprot:g46477.t1
MFDTDVWRSVRNKRFPTFSPRARMQQKAKENTVDITIASSTATTGKEPPSDSSMIRSAGSSVSEKSEKSQKAVTREACQVAARWDLLRRKDPLLFSMSETTSWQEFAGCPASPPAPGPKSTRAVTREACQVAARWDLLRRKDPLLFSMSETTSWQEFAGCPASPPVPGFCRPLIDLPLRFPTLLYASHETVDSDGDTTPELSYTNLTPEPSHND